MQLKHVITTDKGDYILIEQYWLLKDGKVARDTHTEPSRWLYDCVLVSNEILSFDQCPLDVKRAFEPKFKRPNKSKQKFKPNVEIKA